MHANVRVNFMTARRGGVLVADSAMFVSVNLDKLDVILDELGLNLSSVVNIFVKQLVRQGGFPFTLTLETRKATESKRREGKDSDSLIFRQALL